MEKLYAVIYETPGGNDLVLRNVPESKLPEEDGGWAYVVPEADFRKWVRGQDGKLRQKGK